MSAFAVSRVELDTRCGESGRTIDYMQSAHLPTPPKVRNTRAVRASGSPDLVSQSLPVPTEVEESHTDEIYLQIPPVEGPQELKGVVLSATCESK